jgi:tetraacyldisaccharide 4'-kinase
VGGTGKTPHVEYLVELLQQRFKVAVLSRGYKRKTKGFVLASENPTSAEIGDEPTQVKQKFPEIHVAVHESRVKGIKKIMEQNASLVILDDAFQHRYVKPGISILLIDFNRRLDKDFLLPAGNLREYPSGKKRADIIIITKTPLELKPIDRRLIITQINPSPYQELYFTGLEYGSFTPVFGNQIQFPGDFYQNHELYTILLVTGIAYANPFIEMLQKYTNDIRHFKLGDHINYNNQKLDKILNLFNQIDNDRKIIITTEKDAIKIRETKSTDNVLINNLFYIPIKIKFIEKEEEFNQQIIEYVKRNTRNN